VPDCLSINTGEQIAPDLASSMQVYDEDEFKRLQSRFENRCPVMLFSQMDGMSAGRVSRR
jgi:hypothetical protein